MREIRCSSWGKKRYKIRHNVDERDREGGDMQRIYSERLGGISSKKRNVLTMMKGADTRMIVLAPIDGDSRIQEFALKPLIITIVDRRAKIKGVLHNEKHKARL